MNIDAFGTFVSCSFVIFFSPSKSIKLSNVGGAFIVVGRERSKVSRNKGKWNLEQGSQDIAQNGEQRQSNTREGEEIREAPETKKEEQRERQTIGERKEMEREKERNKKGSGKKKEEEKENKDKFTPNVKFLVLKRFIKS